MKATNNVRDINGVKIAVGQIIVFVQNPSETYNVVSDENGDIGFTAQFKRKELCYHEFLRFVEKDDLTTFEVLAIPDDDDFTNQTLEKIWQIFPC